MDTPHWLPLSNLDLLLPPLDVGVIFCYQNLISVTTKLEFGSMVRILKASLAETLVSYYAFAGEIVQNLAGEPEVLCNNSGVNFTEAFADVELKEINFYDPDESIEGKLVPKKKHGVLAVQVLCLNAKFLPFFFHARDLLISQLNKEEKRQLDPLSSYYMSTIREKIGPSLSLLVWPI